MFQSLVDAKKNKERRQQKCSQIILRIMLSNRKCTIAILRLSQSQLFQILKIVADKRLADFRLLLRKKLNNEMVP
ncbi:CLUMA_CG011803, isoform A [Clunio marinus]|uniref:CLUMA_CG011803, isoform A n=1 Tax=Clunio marinus TaxID=568069 RepID=A0A1J1IHD8_9DIPT|nr:CLUMA_CG011803, isoform A [Clunio marinus]